MAPRPRDVVVVGASAGGVEALRSMAAGVPAGLRASVLVVLHMPANGRTALPAILSRSGPLPARIARDGERLALGQIYTARPDHHLLVVDDKVRVSHGPVENGHRPSIDVLFRSAALACGASVTGVLLSGMLGDGVAGLLDITSRGGRAVVQDPADAGYPDMPRRVLRALTPDHVVPAAEIGQVLAAITTELAENASAVAPELLGWQQNFTGTENRRTRTEWRAH